MEENRNQQPAADKSATGLENKVYYPDGYQQDLPLERRLRSLFGDLSSTEKPVLVSYDSKENCTVPRTNLMVQQSYLSDGRLLRCDWRSPQSPGRQGFHVVRVEGIGNTAVATAIAKEEADRESMK